jgi:hypothetical protein
MTVTGKHQSTGTKTCLAATLYITNDMRVGVAWARAFAVTGRQLV